ncbi:peptidase P60 [Pandoraea pneumonica]|uniref:Peptidase P60 n=1 Tax=Pandoraea pneumonica TaxID=2508299 RepID=A0A5E4WU71_9BURK|nr:C40 family peptidase [Pandoraea pneumonica]VVE28081.1 peptidase P60 [Pandoraea pneumonica]
MNETTLQAIREHAAKEYENERRECCGLVIIERGREVYVPCSNKAARNPRTGKWDSFMLPADEYSAAEDLGEIVCAVHSHPDASPEPSQGDLVRCEGSRLPWLIMAWPSGETKMIEPRGYVAPLVGRSFHHGTLDCYALVRDWYERERDIVLPDFGRTDGWWDDGQSDLYRQHYRDAGFEDVADSPAAVHRAVRDLQVGDVILMQIRSKNGVPNHAGVYIGDGCMLHHLHGRLSTRDVYGGYWLDCTRHVLRYVRE